jgi:hypothetical protein
MVDPPLHNLFGGGSSSQRVFPENQAGPRDLQTGFALGGNALLLVFARTRNSRDLYRCTADMPCKGYTVHSVRDGRVCGVGAEVGMGFVMNWVECAGREPAGDS